MSIKEIDPRGPRFGAGISCVLLLTVIYLSLARETFPAALSLLSVIVALFVVGTIFGNAKHPYGYIYKAVVRPFLKAPKVLEDVRPLRFAQLVGLIVTGTALTFGLLGFDFRLGLVIAASAAFLAAFLNVTFAYCLGCVIWVQLARAGLIKA